jgi:hypothetical protein
MPTTITTTTTTTAGVTTTATETVFAPDAPAAPDAPEPEGELPRGELYGEVIATGFVVPCLPSTHMLRPNVVRSRADGNMYRCRFHFNEGPRMKGGKVS